MTQDVSEKPFFVTLPDRALIKITGPDRRAFLQALVSNDIDLLDRQESVYACLLTPQGKFLFDFIVFEDSDALVLDGEGGERGEALLALLKKYKLRSKVDLMLEQNTAIHAIIPPPPTLPSPLCEGEGPVGGAAGIKCDPRHPALGHRSLTRPETLAERPFSAWDSLRIALCIPDGSRDMVPGQSTPIECRIDALNGISFDKGCYIGQELTARMHHRGLAKRHLYAVAWTGPVPAPGADIIVNGALIGQMRSACGQTGLALLKDEATATLPDGPLRLLS